MRLLFILSFLVLPMSALAQFHDPRLGKTQANGLARIEIDEEDYGFVLRDAVWKSTNIPVCWENPEPVNADYQAFVELAVLETWARYSELDFTGWDACPKSSFVGIRILIADTNPHVKKLGSRLSGVRNGMVLNATYNTAGFEACRKSEKMFELCNRVIAVHEFGHAIGLSHEHNRGDRDEGCMEPVQGTDGSEELTPYDPDSVMNYCNPKYGNYGKLSYYDVVTVQVLYGEPG